MNLRALIPALLFLLLTSESPRADEYPLSTGSPSQNVEQSNFAGQLVSSQRRAERRAEIAFQQAKLRPRPNGIGEELSRFGYSVAVDGDRALVAGTGLFGSGGVVVLVNQGGTWVEEGRLIPSDGRDFVRFGYSVSLQGHRALIGTTRDFEIDDDSGAAYVFEYDGENWAETAKLTASDGAENDVFGWSVSLSGDRALVGAPGDDDNGDGSGAAYMFERAGQYWTQTEKLTAGDPTLSFGRSVSLDGDRAVVGATSAYIFEFDGSSWVETEKIDPDGGPSGNGFGSSVSLSGDQVLIGDTTASDSGSRSGAAYVFERNGSAWMQIARLLASDGSELAYFGSSVALSGDRAVVGAAGAFGNGANSGAAYVFDFDGVSWTESSKLVADDQTGQDIGYAVGLDDDTALVGAYRTDDHGFESGSAYVFINDGVSWSQTARLSPGASAAFDEFGFSVSLSGNRALVGAPRDDDNGPDAGAAYLFEWDEAAWTETAKLTPMDGVTDDRFGTALSLFGDRAVVGASGDDDNGDFSGSAYVFDFDGSNWTQTAKLTASDATALDYFGVSISLSSDRVLIGASGTEDNGLGSGAAYIFDFDGLAWVEAAKLISSDGEPIDLFGGDGVSLFGDTALIGVQNDDDNGSASGSAYIFDFDGTDWGQTTKLTPADSEANDRFGKSVSLHGNRAVIGAIGDDENGDSSGSVYIYEFDGSDWSETAKLLSSDGDISDSFGSSVSLIGNQVLIGAPGDSDNGRASGSAYLFELDETSWTQTRKLTPSDSRSFDNFGTPVSLSDGKALIGERLADDNGSRSGAAYIFDRGDIFSDGFESSGRQENILGIQAVLLQGPPSP